jgi:type IV secretory pathway VirB10-like protein
MQQPSYRATIAAGFATCDVCRLNMTLAIILAICAMFCASVPAAALAHPGLQTPQTQENKPQGNTAEQEAKPQAPTAPAQPCEQSKDTCELPPEPQEPAAQPASPPVQNQPETPAKPSSQTSTAKQSPNHKEKKKKKAKATASGPRKIIVRDGGTSEPKNQLSPGNGGQQSAAARQTTDQLLASTQANLKTVSTRTLSSNQQATVEQIKMFVEQANSALKEGDLQRGRNLAMKAQLLSDDLVKH